MNLRDLIGSFRTEAADTAIKPLWSDDLVARFFAEAEEEAAIRKKLLFDDSTAAITPLAVVAGANTFTVDPRWFVITGIHLWNGANTKFIKPLRPITRGKLDQMFNDWRNDRGEPVFFIHEDTRLVLPGYADRAYTLRVEGYRIPLVPINDPDGPMFDAVPEIATIHHRFLVHWALHRAYGVEDADTFDANRRDRELAEFVRYFGLRPDADLYKDTEADQVHANVGYW